jgi:hypothetical protein
MSMVGFPLLLIPLAIFNIIVFLMPGVAFTDVLVQIPLVSGEMWGVSLGDILLALGVLLLLLEIIKAARPGGRYLTDHLLSLLVFAGAAAEFVMWPKFANSTYFLLTLLAMVEFFSGIALRTKRRSRAVVAVPAAPSPAVEAAPEPEPEPVVEPVPVPAATSPEPPPAPVPVVVTPAPEPEPKPPSAPVPTAASVAESVLLDHPDPRPAPPVATPSEPSPKVIAPELQPEVAPSAPPAAPEEPKEEPEAPKP